MDLYKRDPIFFGFCTVSLLVFIAASAFIFIESGKLSKAKVKVANADSNMKSLMYSDPAPSSSNVKAARKNLEALEEKLADIYEELQEGSHLDVTNDGVKFVSSIQKYINDFRKKVAKHEDTNSVASPIDIPNDRFAFGFESYLEDIVIPDGDVVSKLDKQRQILSYLIDKLIESDPTSIRAVEREVVENSSDNATGFTIDPSISARVPGIIDTLAFRVQFTGYTQNLRRFLNGLAHFKMPIVVRSVSVKRLQASPVLPEQTAFSTNETNDSGKTPVISETESIFTITLEFIEIILPPDSEGEFNQGA